MVFVIFTLSRSINPAGGMDCLGLGRQLVGWGGWGESYRSGAIAKGAVIFIRARKSGVPVSKRKAARGGRGDLFSIKRCEIH
ncbi:MAG: hypothetical protein CMH76_07030 [Nitrospinae bacterium]|nr:hypothetical protein [Nitrospinota bacterium]